MDKWSIESISNWHEDIGWLVGANFLPSSAINQLEMFQQETYDEKTISRELDWAKQLGFNSMRVYLHDLLWEDKKSFINNFNSFLDCCFEKNIRLLVVLFDDCHRPNPQSGIQPLPLRGLHNSGWAQSPGHKIVNDINQNINLEIPRLKLFVQEVLDLYRDDERIFMWDIYNEPGQFGIGDNSLKLLTHTWDWAKEVRPSQPLTSCLEGSVGKEIISLNKRNSDVITFHTYESTKLESTISELKEIGRPLMCTEYMAREFGTTFEFSLPIFKKNNVSCFNWGFVAGKSQTHFGWETIMKIQELMDAKDYLKEDEQIPEPQLWFHDIYRKDGTPFDAKETDFIKNFLKSNA